MIFLASVNGKNEDFKEEKPKYPKITKAIIMMFTATGYFIKYAITFFISYFLDLFLISEKMVTGKPTYAPATGFLTNISPSFNPLTTTVFSLK